MEISIRTNSDMGFEYVSCEYFILRLQKTFSLDFRSNNMSFSFQFGNDLLYLLSNQRKLKLPLTRFIKHS